MRGVLIKMGAEKKRKDKDIRTTLIKEIHKLEQQHKHDRTKEILLNLNIKREELREQIEQETRSMFNQVKKERYLWDNKPGKHLANLLKKKKKRKLY